MTTIYLVRHGETDWNRERRIQGSTDIPLNDTGRAQAALTGRLLAAGKWDAVVASPMSRALETAAIIAREIGLPAPTTLDAIVERAYGAAEGLDWVEVDELFPGDAFVPGRESREEVAARAVPALVALAEKHPGEALIVVSHGGVIRAVLNTVDPDTNHGPITNGSVHSFVHSDGSLELIAFNDPLEALTREALSNEARSHDHEIGDIEEQNAIENRDAHRNS
jgi:probable phosphoglycerate mutase